MAFERTRFVCWLAVLSAASACKHGGLQHKFPLVEPMVFDSDQHPFSQRPEENYSPFGWDAADQTIFRPISRFFAVDPAGGASNVNALDEVPDSSWFINRIGQTSMTPAQLAVGPCDVPPLDPNGPWIISGAKPDGANPGFLIKAGGQRFLIKFDGTEQGPRATAADVLGSRLYHAAGYHVPCNRIVYFHRSILQVAPDAEVERRIGRKRPLRQDDLDTVFSKAVRLRDGRYRASSSMFLQGKPLGPWRYQGTRDDDPNDVVPHEDRRELRGMRLLAAWINHFDSREQNTLANWIEVGKGMGYVRHNVLDFGDSLGSLWEPPPLGRRIGHAYYLDVPYVVEDWLTLGLVKRPWERARFGASGPVFGYFDADSFDPELWRPGYPNPAFGRMRERDAAWMARIIARFSDDHVRAMVATADLRHPVLESELLKILLGRRDRILNRYLTRLSPLTDPELSASGPVVELCLTDLLVRSGRIDKERRAYTRRAFVGEALRPTEVRAGQRSGDRTCAVLPRAPGASAKTPGYLIVDFIARSAGLEPQPPARVHLYDLGDHYRVVGLERPDDADAPE